MTASSSARASKQTKQEFDSAILNSADNLSKLKRDTALADYSSMLAILFQYPTQSLIDGIASGTFCCDFDAIAQELEIPNECRQNARARLLPCQEKASTDPAYFSAARREYTRLFNHPDNPAIQPYESLFIDKERMKAGKKSMDPRMFINPAALDAERCYRRIGLKRTATMNIPADFIATELGFLGTAFHMLTEAILRNDAERVTETDDVIREFSHLHAFRWFGCFFEQCIQESKVDLYRAAGAIGLAYIEVLERCFSIPKTDN